MTYAIQKTDAEWQALLRDKGAEPAAFQVTRHAATERPFTGKYERHWADGSYLASCSRTPRSASEKPRALRAW